MRGNITRRGKSSWRLKFDIGRDPRSGKRATRFVTFRDTRRDAEAELARQIAAVTSGNFIDVTKVTVADYLRSWINTVEASLSAKTSERYRELIHRQLIPFMGVLQLQKLKPAHIAEWHSALLREGRYDGSGLNPRTVGHAHRLLHKALADAVVRELLSRNPASLITPPKANSKEVEILSITDIETVLDALRDDEIYPHIVMLLSTGIRRGELMGLQWGDVDLEQSKLCVERSVEATRVKGIRTKLPKSRHGRRVITLPDIAVEVLRELRKAQLEARVKLGIGKLQPSHHVFGDMVGAARHPGWITDKWREATRLKGLPRVTLHALRHCHASALIASGHDVVTVSRRMGHSSPTVTLAVYAHLFHKTDEAAASSIHAILRPNEKKS